MTGYTVADLAKRLRIGRDKVRGFIQRGEIVAVNVAGTLAGKPQWRITAESVERFENRRSSAPTPTVRRIKRAQVDYYPD
jgi:excisionase family DNA binding protein